MYVSVDDGDDPVAVVEGPVVGSAEENEVVDGCFAAVDPGLEMVGVTVDGWGAAHDAALVADVQGAAHRSRHQALGPADSSTVPSRTNWPV
jgi:hypothetical protein